MGKNNPNEVDQSDLSDAKTLPKRRELENEVVAKLITVTPRNRTHDQRTSHTRIEAQGECFPTTGTLREDNQNEDDRTHNNMEHTETP